MSPVSVKGLIVAAPSSGSGKTLVTLALLRAFKNSGRLVRSAKIGPDYIDPAFHGRASGAPCPSLDTWAMRASTVDGILAELSQADAPVIAEGAMGLFDGADNGSGDADGSSASLARLTGWPVVLVVDARAQAASAAALVRGFVEHDSGVCVTGVLFNRVGSSSHEGVLRRAMARHLPGIGIFGCLPRQADLELPSRHLGLVQAAEHDDLDAFLDRAATWISGHVHLDSFLNSTMPYDAVPANQGAMQIPALGQRIAVARDEAFAFAYETVLSAWRRSGIEIFLFSPLNGEGPQEDADAVYLPGGYPELHAGRLSNNGFLDHLRNAAEKKVPMYGECGGFMVLGNTLTDGGGHVHRMAGLLDVDTSFADRKLHLGYRRMRTQVSSPLGGPGSVLRGHEFHYASTTRVGSDQPLFSVADARGGNLENAGLARGSVAGSFMHLIDYRQY